MECICSGICFTYLIGKIALFSTFRKDECICAILIGIVALGSVLEAETLLLWRFFIIMLAAKGESPRRLVMVFAVIKRLHFC